MPAMRLSEIEALAVEALKEAGANEANAAAVARTITRAERDGSESHGLFRLPGYIGALKSGQVNGAADPQMSDRAPGIIRVDAQKGFAPLAQEIACAPLVARAMSQGIAMAALNNIHHFAALWPEVEMLAEEGLVGLAVTAALPYVAPAGGKEALFGTNPMAFAWPRDGKPPFAFDQAASTLARGEIMLAARDGHQVPDGVGLDAHGNPTNDPAAILSGGVQEAFGGYKGSAIALMVELMAGAMIGDRFSYQAEEELGGKSNLPIGGEFILAIDPKLASGGSAWLAQGEALLGRIEGMDGARLAGARRHANRGDQGAREVPESVMAAIKAARN